MIHKIEVGQNIVYLKKGFAGWKVVHPIKNEDGSLNWKNLLIGGSWWNLFGLTAIIILILLAVQEYSTTLQVANECLNKTQTIILP